MRFNLVGSLETKSCLSCHPVGFFQKAKVLQFILFLKISCNYPVNSIYIYVKNIEIQYIVL
jgi:hypothetical protein